MFAAVVDLSVLVDAGRSLAFVVVVSWPTMYSVVTRQVPVDAYGYSTIRA